MSRRTARVLAAGYFVVMLLVVTWPGALPFARVRPLILGLPFSLAWVSAWIIGSIAVLWGLDRVERRHREDD